MIIDCISAQLLTPSGTISRRPKCDDLELDNLTDIHIVQVMSVDFVDISMILVLGSNGGLSFCCFFVELDFRHGAMKHRCRSRIADFSRFFCLFHFLVLHLLS